MIEQLTQTKPRTRVEAVAFIRQERDLGELISLLPFWRRQCGYNRQMVREDLGALMERAKRGGCLPMGELKLLAGSLKLLLGSQAALWQERKRRYQRWLRA